MVVVRREPVGTRNGQAAPLHTVVDHVGFVLSLPARSRLMVREGSMPGWKSAAGWMEFPYLDQGEGLDRAYTLAYKVTDDQTEHWTSRFVRFKAKEEQALYGAAAVLKSKFPDLLGHLKLNPKSAVIIPALGSADKCANPKKHIPRLGQVLGKQSGLVYDPEIVSKDPHRPLHLLGSAGERLAELEKANYVAKAVNAKTALVLDDFITQGATLAITARKLKEATPDLTVIGVALGKTERTNWGASNAHVPQEWDGLWLAGEQYYLDRKKIGA